MGLIVSLVALIELVGHPSFSGLFLAAVTRSESDRSLRSFGSARKVANHPDGQTDRERPCHDLGREGRRSGRQRGATRHKAKFEVIKEH